jgi:hypothetical protein
VPPPNCAFHFISGLPRAGSTLTAAILRQNPRFHAGMSSPVAGPVLFQRYPQLSFWRDLKDSKAFRIVTQASAEKQRETMPEPAAAIVPGSTQ